MCQARHREREGIGQVSWGQVAQLGLQPTVWPRSSRPSAPHPQVPQEGQWAGPAPLPARGGIQAESASTPCTLLCGLSCDKAPHCGRTQGAPVLPEEQGFQLGVGFCLQRDTWQRLGTFWIDKTGWRVLLASRG